MKKFGILGLALLLTTGCTISDKFTNWNTTADNVGKEDTFFPVDLGDDGDFGSCNYLFGIYKLDNDCSINDIAKYRGFKTITSVETQWILYPFVLTQRNYVFGS